MPSFVSVDKLRHLDEELLERYAMKVCSEEDSAVVDEHLGVCWRCQMRLYAAGEWVEFITAVLTETAPGGVPIDDRKRDQPKGQTVRRTCVSSAATRELRLVK